MLLYNIIISILSFYYVLLIIYLYFGLKKVHYYNSMYIPNYKKRTYSIVICAHNEQECIEQCLISVLQQTYTSEYYEVILVNDRSHDRTLEKAQHFLQKYSNFHIISVNQTPQNYSPKKYALSQGIASAKHEIIVVTDADCEVQAEWLETLNLHYQDTTGLVQGITHFSQKKLHNSLFQKIQALDFASHSIISAAGIGINFPINSNANNFSFRKNIYMKLFGYSSIQSIVSGDDDLLLQKIWKKKQWNIRYCTHPRAAVTTQPSATVKEFLEQRKRWASKTIHYNIFQRMVLSGIFIFYCSILISFCLSVFNYSLIFTGLSTLCIKIMGEMVVLWKGTNLIHQSPLRKYFLASSLIHLPLVIYSVFNGVLGSFKWKDQTFKRKIEQRT